MMLIANKINRRFSFIAFSFFFFFKNMTIPAMVKTRANTPKPAPAEITIASFVSEKVVAINRKSFYTKIWMLKGWI